MQKALAPSLAGALKHALSQKHRGDAVAIAFFDQVLDPRYCRFLLEEARQQLTQRAFTRSNFSWDEDVRRQSAPVLIRELPDVPASLIKSSLVERGVIDDTDYVVMNYAWTKLSYIPWHNDEPHQTGITVYLNDNWDADWGGLFLYRDAENCVRGYIPRFNCAIRNDGNLVHMVTPVALDAEEPRFTLQLFKRKPEQRG